MQSEKYYIKVLELSSQVGLKLWLSHSLTGRHLISVDFLFFPVEDKNTNGSHLINRASLVAQKIKRLPGIYFVNKNPKVKSIFHLFCLISRNTLCLAWVYGKVSWKWDMSCTWKSARNILDPTLNMANLNTIQVSAKASALPTLFS